MNTLHKRNMEMFDMDILFVDDVEKIKNREDRSKLLIFATHPELFLASDVAHPEEVKYLTINQHFDDHDLKLRTKITEYYKKNPNVVLPPVLDSDKECANLVNFHNIEVFRARALELSSEVWLHFIKNCKKLKEIDFSCGDDQFYDAFEFEEKTEVLDALFQIPTLETVKMWCNRLCYFPPGPSNIKHLELECVTTENDELGELHKDTWKTNFSTHTNIKYLRLVEFKDSPYQLKDLNLGKMISLEEIILENWEIDSDCFESILMLPNLKRIELLTWFSYHISKIPDLKNLINNLNLRFPSVEEVIIHIPHDSRVFNFEETKECLTDKLEKQCLNIKKININSINKKRNGDV